jgi:hypothetical protein
VLPLFGRTRLEVELIKAMLLCPFEHLNVYEAIKVLSLSVCCRSLLLWSPVEAGILLEFILMKIVISSHGGR